MDKIAVIGGGEMGHGIAELASANGFRVSMVDQDKELLEDAIENIEWSLEKLVDDGTLQVDPEAAMNRIDTTTDLEKAVVDADAVIEAVPEDIDLKKDVFADLDEYAPPEAILGTNTSGIPITEIANATENPDRVIGMHFFNPVMLMNLIEIVRGEATSDETTRKAVRLTDELDKESVVVRKDVPGFITSRTILPYMLEAAWQLHEENAELEEMDAAGKYGAGFPMGPFELADQTGLDVPVKGVDKGSFREDIFAIAPNQRELVEEGHHGKKTGKGWHDWEDGEGCTATPDQADAFDPVVLIAPTVNEAARLIEWNVADHEEIDLAMRLGTAYPKGPCRLGDSIGLDEIVAALEENPRHEPVDLLREMVADGRTGKEAGEGFYDYGQETPTEFFTLQYEADADRSVATITLDRPERQNSLNQEMFSELDAAIDLVAAADEIQCLVVRGNGTFCAGADINMVSNLSQYEFVTTPMGEVFTRLEELPTPSIAAIDGHCLGGGLELALGCDFRVASEASELGAMEINLGLLPGGGGTQRLIRTVGYPRAKEMVMLGNRLTAEEANEADLVTRVVPDGEFDERVAELADELASGPPIAQHAAKIAIHQGGDAPLDSGLSLEKAVVALLLETDDLSEGIDAFFSGRDPQFEGE